MGRKHISDKKRAAIFALALGDVPYDDAKKMTEDQILSLYHLDHDAILNDSGHADRDEYWNYKPRLIRDHREKTKRDMMVIAKGRRVRRKLAEHRRKQLAKVYEEYRPYDLTGRIADALMKGFHEGARNAYDRMDLPRNTYSENYNAIDWNKKPKRKIRSRGFDKTKRRKMDGTVVKR
jgi:hypothetical protein